MIPGHPERELKRGAHSKNPLFLFKKIPFFLRVLRAALSGALALRRLGFLFFLCVWLLGLVAFWLLAFWLFGFSVLVASWSWGVLAFWLFCACAGACDSSSSEFLEFFNTRPRFSPVSSHSACLGGEGAAAPSPPPPLRRVVATKGAEKQMEKCGETTLRLWRPKRANKTQLC